MTKAIGKLRYTKRIRRWNMIRERLVYVTKERLLIADVADILGVTVSRAYHIVNEGKWPEPQGRTKGRTPNGAPLFWITRDVIAWFTDEAHQ